MTVQYLTKDKRKGVFLSMKDWQSLNKELDSLRNKIYLIEKRRKEILLNSIKSKKEKLIFSSDIHELKASLQ